MNFFFASLHHDKGRFKVIYWQFDLFFEGKKEENIHLQVVNFDRKENIFR